MDPLQSPRSEEENMLTDEEGTEVGLDEQYYKFK
jgi:hypothetical protein